MSVITTKSQLWSPDTCACVIEMQYETGPDISLQDITFSLKKIHRKCEFHVTLATDDEVFAAVTEENPRKNRSMAQIIQNAPTEWVEIANQKTGEKKLKEGIAIDYDFIKEEGKSKRTLQLSVIGVDSTTLSDTKKTELQNKLDTAFSNKEIHGDAVLKGAKLTRDDVILVASTKDATTKTQTQILGTKK